MAESSEDSSEEDEGGAVEIRPRAGAQGAHQVGFCLFFACLFVCLFVFVCLYICLLRSYQRENQADSQFFFTQQSA